MPAVPTLPALTPALIFDHVSLRAPVGRATILSDVSFTVAAGAFVGLVGASGAGKTSLLRLVNRLVDPSEGEILWQGQRVRSHPVIAYRQQVTLVLQESTLLGLTVAENLQYPSLLRGQSTAQAQQTLQPWLARLKIPNSWMGKTAPELSVGQRQRVALARGLITRPRLLLLDEPTAAQDMGYTQDLLNTLNQLTQSEGLTVLMANHQLDQVAQAVTEVLHLEAGRLVGHWPAHEVDWPHLRQAIISTNQQSREEWEQDDWN
ncbi:MAG: ATP-binding cassette domain-containing protein [Cyanobacteria bacterium P01_A01_bin.105]